MVRIENHLGTIDISRNFFVNLVGATATSCFGVAGMAVSDPAQGFLSKFRRDHDGSKGVKIRTMVDPIQMNCWEAFGASVTPVPYAELYTALQQKLVDAQENPPSNIVSSKIYEMQSYCMKTNHNFTTTIMAASPVFWSTLSEEDKVFIQDLWKETEMYVRSPTEDLSDGFFDEMQSKGTTVDRKSVV